MRSAAVERMHNDELVLCGHRQTIDEDRLDDQEHRGRYADAEPEDRYCSECVGRRAADAADDLLHALGLAFVQTGFSGNLSRSMMRPSRITSDSLRML